MYKNIVFKNVIYQNGAEKYKPPQGHISNAMNTSFVPLCISWRLGTPSWLFAHIVKKNIENTFNCHY